MSVIKLSKKDIIKKDDEDKKIKLKKNQLSYDSALASEWEISANESFKTLQKYQKKLENQEYLSSEDLEGYKSAMERYIENSNRLRGINKTLGKGFTEEEEKQWNDSVSSVQSGYTEISDYFSKFKTEKDFKNQMAAIKQTETMRAEDQKALEANLYEKKSVYNYWNNMASNPLVEKSHTNSVSDSIESFFDKLNPMKSKYIVNPNANNDFVIPNTSKAIEQDRNDINSILGHKQLGDEGLLAQVTNSKYAGLTLEELQNQIKEDEKYLTQVRYLQNYDYLTQNDVSLEELESHLGDEDRIAYTDPTNGKNITWQKLVDDKKFEQDFGAMYDKYSAMPDWAEKSKFVSQAKPKEELRNLEDFGTNLELEYMHGDDEFRDMLSTARYGKAAQNNSAGARSLYDFGDMYGYDQLEDKEKELATYLYYADANAYNDYKKFLGDQLMERRNQAEVQRAYEMAQEYPLGSSLLSIGYSMAGGIEFLADSAMGTLDEGNQNAAISSSIRQGVSDTVDWEIGNWDVFDFLYNTGMSMADSAVAMGTMGGFGGIALGLSAAGQGVNDALDRGLTSKEAFWSGVAAGTFEMLFETVSIGQFNALKDSLESGGKAVAKNMAKSMLVNASEETLTEIANITYDTFANADFSNYETMVRTYVMQGMSIEQAETQAKRDMRSQVIEAAASGALMGFGFGAIGSVSAHKKAKAIEGQYDAESVNALVEEGLSMPGSEAYELAQKAQGKLNEGKSLSAQELVDLVEANEKAFNKADVSKMAQAAEARLAELGEGESASMLADIIAKRAAGQKLTASEKALLKNSKYGQRVANEMSPENIASGDYASAWAENIGTDRINTEAYNMGLYDLAQETVNEVAPAEGKPSPTKENLVESKYEVSAEGKNINKTNDELINVVGIESIKDGEMVLRVENDEGKTEAVNAKDVAFTNDDALIYSAVADMGASESAAWNIVKNFKATDGVSANTYAQSVPFAYKYGVLNYQAGLKNLDLTTDQAMVAFYQGRNDAETKLKAKTTKPTITAKKKANSKVKGKVIFEGFEYNENTANDLQKASMAGINFIAEISPLEVHVYKSFKENGQFVTYINGKKRLAPNGYFIEGTNKIYIDINAGAKGEGLMLDTAGHEITHYIAEWNWDGFKELGDFLFEHYGADVPVNTLINNQKNRIIESYKRDGKALPSEEELFKKAYEETVADAMSKMLADKRAYTKLTELRQQNQTLWEKIGEAIKNLLDKIKSLIGVYSQQGAAFDEAKYVEEFSKDVYEKLQDLYLKAFVEANENYEFADIVNIDADSKSVSPMMSERTWTESEYVTEREKTAKAISSALDVDIKTAYKYIDDINGVARLIADDRARLDYDPNIDEDATVLKKNSEYKYSVDMSTLCAKRLLTTGTFDAIQRKLPNTVFSSEDIVALREMMLKRGYEVACGICYVESTRREMGRITQDFINSYIESQKTGNPITRINSSGQAVDLKKTKDEMLTTADKSANKFYADKNYTPTLADLNTTDIDLVKKEHPLVYEAYLNFMNARGQAKPKLLETRAEYKGEILKHFKTPSAVNARNKAGGLRLQSFSDFEVPHMIDMMQIVMDMSRVGLKSQAYTKVPAFAEVFGNTGVKINLSLIAKGSGLDVNGNLIFDDVEGINHEEAFRLRDKFSKNVGTILVGKTDAHIIAAMADPRIDYIIPFHKSSWKESLYDALGLTGYADYTDFQNEKPIDKDRKIKNFDPSEYWDFTKSGDENAQIYLEKCREDGRIPKFPQFQGYPGYWKLLIDFKMYDNDGAGSPQEVVRPTFETEASERILNEYKGGHKSFPVAKDVVEDFVNDYVHNAKFSEKESNELKFSLRESVEETADLLAIHNITPKLLADALGRDNLLMPSLAVTNKAFVDFGDISLVFDKSTIDPNQSKDNKLYGADAWTPTQTELKKNPRFDTNKTVKAVNAIKNRLGSKLFKTLFDVSPKQFKEAIAKADGSIFAAYADNLGVQTAYAIEKGVISKVPVKNGDVDMAKLKEQIHSELDTDNGWRQYKRWLNGISDDIITAYDPATNDDILRNMKSQPASAKPFKLSENGELVAPAAEYGNIDDMRRNKGRLSENADVETKKVAKKLITFARNLSQKSSVKTADVVNAINSAFNGRYNIKNIVSVFSANGININNTVARELQALYKEAVELPTPYFEAKPQRSVGLNEVAAAVIPDNTSAELKSLLTEKGVNFIEYENGNEKSRLEALNSLEEVKFSERDSDDFASESRIPYTNRANQFSYEALTSKPDMKVTSLEGKIPNNRADVVYQAKKNAASVGKTNKNGSVSVYVDDVGTDVVLATKGLSHGLRRISKAQTAPNFFVTLKAGEIIKNSIKINELLPSKENASGSYVLIGVAKNRNGDMYIVRSVVNRFNNELDSMDILYAINAKKEELAATKSPRFTAKPLSVTSSAISITDLLDYVNEYFPDILPEDVLRHYKHEERPSGDFSESVLFSERDRAPIFYSRMGKVIEGVKQEKLAANSVVNMLRGKGVKAEEIRWSGVVPFLEGKKSVTKQELLDFINGSMLQIGEQMSGEDVDLRYDGSNHTYRLYDKEGNVINTYTYNEFMGGYVSENDDEIYTNSTDIEDAVREEYGSLSSPRWADYKLDGGTNYREIVFTMPNSTYSNAAMRVHWGQDAEGVLVHARVQDFEVNGKKMLFIEELQSDWHNQGHKEGYESDITADDREGIDKLGKTIDALNEQHETLLNEKGTLDYEYFKEEKMSFDEYSAKAVEYVDKIDKIVAKINRSINKRENLFSKVKKAVPDAPFKDTYHEFVLKRLLRMAAEQGYDSIGWTPAEIQSKRWSDEFAEGYRIEYDQDMPKFLKKYGRQWGAKVGKTDIQTKQLSMEEEMDNALLEDWIIDEDAGETEESVAEQMRKWKGLTSVWSMDITDSMKESVLYEGQVMHSERDTSTSNRSILANALEGAAQNDIEKNKLAQYKEKIALIETEEQRLSEIQKQLFTKGGVDSSQRKELQFEAKQIANRINTYDRQLLNLEATTALKNVLNREKALAMKRQKQKDTEYLKQYKEKVAKTQRELLERNQESRKKAIEGREKTAMRHKIKSVVNDLNTLLLKPTKERHVPEEMKIAVAEALTVVNMDTVGADERVAKYNDLIAKAKDPDVIASLTETRDRILNQGSKLGKKLTKLKDAYGMARDSADDSVRSMYDDVIYSKIESVQRTVGKTPLRNMTLAQLEGVYDLYRMVLTTIRDSNKAFAENLKMTRLALGSNTFAEIKDNNKARDTIKHESIEKFMWQNLKPMQAMKTIGSGTLQKLWNNVLYGQEVFAVDYDEAVKFAKEMKEKYGYKKWNLDKLYSFESKSGKAMKINLEQMMSIYAYSKRAQADEHIEYGGIVLNEGIRKEKNKWGKVVEVKVNDSTAYRLDKMQVANIVATLEKEFPGAKAFVDEMQKYLSETMGEKGNEVSMKMYGIKLFKEEHYFPLKSSKDFMEAANAKLKGDVKIKNKGMTKSTVEHARNPIVLENFLDVWGNHINEMAMYHGLVLPLEDFSRTLNYSFKADDSLNTDAESVRTALHDAFGDNADNYLNELLKAINGGVLHDSSAQIADKMISKFKKAKVMASLSVIVQQPTAIIRAMGIIEPKYFTSQNFHHKQTWEELKKYCPTAIIKETGSFDTNMGRTIVDMVKEDRNFTDKVGDALGKAPAYMDEIGWNMIWRALKKKVAAEQKLSGEALLQECGKQMTLIINETQVYDSVMSRNELMRSKSALTKMATAFMAEPTTVANMIYGAALDAKRGNKGTATKTVAATIASVVINGLVSSLVYAFRDDDEEKTWLEKYLTSATTEVIDGLNPLTYVPFVKDIYSLFQGYKVERTDMALIKDVVNAINDFYNVLDPEAYEGMSKDEIAKHIYGNTKPLLTSLCDMFGLPVGNILRDTEAIFLNDNIPLSQTSSSGSGYAFKEGWLGALPATVGKIVGNDSKQDKLYDAIVSEDAAYIKRLKSGYKDDKAYETAIKKALRENDPRIREAAELRKNGEVTKCFEIVDKIASEKHFSRTLIISAVNAELQKLKREEKQQ